MLIKHNGYNISISLSDPGGSRQISCIGLCQCSLSSSAFNSVSTVSTVLVMDQVVQVMLMVFMVMGLYLVVDKCSSTVPPGFSHRHVCPPPSQDLGLNKGLLLQM